MRWVWQPTPVFFSGESPWTEEPGGLQSMGLQRVGHDWMTKHSTRWNFAIFASWASRPGGQTQSLFPHNPMSIDKYFLIGTEGLRNISIHRIEVWGFSRGTLTQFITYNCFPVSFSHWLELVFSFFFMHVEAISCYMFQWTNMIMLLAPMKIWEPCRWMKW